MIMDEQVEFVERRKETTDVIDLKNRKAREYLQLLIWKCVLTQGNSSGINSA